MASGRRPAGPPPDCPAAGRIDDEHGLAVATQPRRHQPGREAHIGVAPEVRQAQQLEARPGTQRKQSAAVAASPIRS